MSSYIHQTQSTNKDTEYMSAKGPPGLDHNSPKHTLASARMQGLQNPVAGDQSAGSQIKPDSELEPPAVDNVMEAESRGSLGDTGGSHYLNL
ncbi:hypothetical protein BDV09DRAFT_190480 [Aspergillus tetrazonus]